MWDPPFLIVVGCWDETAQMQILNFSTFEFRASSNIIQHLGQNVGWNVGIIFAGLEHYKQGKITALIEFQYKLGQTLSDQ